MIIALPATNHDHLADALVRDLGFKRRHVDAPLRELLLALDPCVDSGVAMANMGSSPRLSSKLEQMGGNDEEGRWTRLLNPPRPGSVPDQIATEVQRLLDVVRGWNLGRAPEDLGDVVVVGVDSVYQMLDSGASKIVALRGRFELEPGAGEAGVDYWLEDAGIVGEQDAIVNYVRELRTRPAVPPGVVVTQNDDGSTTIHNTTDREVFLPFLPPAEDLPGLADFDLVPPRYKFERADGDVLQTDLVTHDVTLIKTNEPVDREDAHDAR